MNYLSIQNLKKHFGEFTALQDISQLPPDQRDFGIVFQSYALFPNLTVADNIAYGLKNSSDAKVRQRDAITTACG